MPRPLGENTIRIVKATVPALEAHGLAITRRMYERMFQNPEIRDLFNQSHHGETGSQPRALAAAVLAWVLLLKWHLWRRGHTVVSFASQVPGPFGPPAASPPPADRDAAATPPALQSAPAAAIPTPGP